VVEPFENHQLAAKIGKVVRGAFRVRKGEFRGGFTGFHGGEAGEAKAKGEQREEKVFSHEFNIPWKDVRSSRGITTLSAQRFKDYKEG